MERLNMDRTYLLKYLNCSNNNCLSKIGLNFYDIFNYFTDYQTIYDIIIFISIIHK